MQVIVGSKFRRGADKSESVSASFLDDIRPFERARIISGLRDLIALEVLESHYDDDRGAYSISMGPNFDSARVALEIPNEVNIQHLKR